MAWVNLNELYVPRETYENDMQDVNSNIEKLQDMMSYTDWVDLYRSNQYFVRYKKDGNTGWLTWDFQHENTTYWEAGTLPEEFWPAGTVWASGVMASSIGYLLNNLSLCYISTVGTVGFQLGAAVDGARNTGIVSWPLVQNSQT